MASVRSVAAMPGRRRGGRVRLLTRLAVELFVLAVLITGACAWTAIALVDGTFRQQSREELQVLTEGARREVELQREQVRESVDAVAAALRADPQLLERFMRAERDLRDEAARLMRPTSLTYLFVLDAARIVLSSGHDPEQIGLEGPPFEPLPLAGTAVLRVKLGETIPVALVARHDIEVGTRTLVVVGGRDLDRRFVERVAGRQAALLIERDAEGQVTSTASRTATAMRPRELWERLSADPSGPRRHSGPGGEVWLVEQVDLPAGFAESGCRLVAGIDLSREETLRRDLVDAFVLLGSGVGLLAALAGVWIARRTVRPVGDLVGAFDAIARGEADYTFSTRAPDELDELVTAFSHLHRALEHQRRRSMATERVAAWREVARHVAHEVKNPLAPIRLTVENLLRARSQAPERFDAMFREGMQTILEEVQQLSRMVAEFAEFARLPLPAHQSVDLAGLIDRVADLYASEPGLTLRSTVEPDMAPVELDPDQVSRALKNVVGNAIDAAREEAGRIGGQPSVEIRAGIADDMAQIVVLDNGPGFTGEAGRRLFEPYFTTKEHGTGLGMALTYRVIIEHGGVIFADNRPEGGARVVIRLPLEAPEPRAARAETGAQR